MVYQLHTHAAPLIAATTRTANGLLMGDLLSAGSGGVGRRSGRFRVSPGRIFPSLGSGGYARAVHHIKEGDTRVDHCEERVRRS
jgi:hypothetical protein